MSTGWALRRPQGLTKCMTRIYRQAATCDAASCARCIPLDPLRRSLVVRFPVRQVLLGNAANQRVLYADTQAGAAAQISALTPSAWPRDVYT